MLSASDRNGSSDTRQIFLYFGCLTLLVYLATPAGYLVDIQTSYMLKNQLHATATQVSTFRLLTGIPAYFSFAFGLMRDQWNPLGLRDRGFFLIVAPVTALGFIFMAKSHLSYRGLLFGMLLVMLSFRFVVAAYQGLMALVGQEKLMSGRLSALWNIVCHTSRSCRCIRIRSTSLSICRRHGPSHSWRPSLCLSPSSVSGSLALFSTTPMKSRRPGALISLERSSGW